MRSAWAVPALYLLLAALAESAINIEGRGILRRASDEAFSAEQPSSTAFSPGTSSLAIASTDGIASSAPSSSSPQSDSHEFTSAKQTGSEIATGTIGHAASTISIASTATPSTAKPSAAQATYSASNGADLDQLPIKPAITPGLSLAGAILMLTGVVYTLIGIRTKWLHIFLSSAYLVSLAVTVLVIYVMHTPVSNAIQGAYFVAAFITGIVFGIGSVVFSDITECLGCLLGGFCLSMWFLVLRPGGLVSSTVGRIVMIGCFSVAASGLYFFRLTRAYGLIGSTAFAGATVITLGIDCFSRAGLKEFWMYIWNLNDDVFPPHYHGPYPVTRGIRVEIAAIVLLFLVGVISQLKVWKFVKKRREQKEAYRVAEERRQEQAELDLGRRLEEGNIQEKIRWEATYSDKKLVDSGIGTGTTNTPRKSSTSAQEAQQAHNNSSEVIVDKGASKIEARAQEPTRITVRVASEDSIHELPSSTARDSVHQGLLAKPQASEAEHKSHERAVNRNSSRLNPDQTRRPREIPELEIGPIKVKVPNASDDEDRSSIATFAASEHISPGISERLSGATLLRNFSKRSKGESNQSAYPESDNNDEDRASSVAATIDDIDDGVSSRGAASDAEVEMIPTPEDNGGTSKSLLSGGDVALLTFDNLQAGEKASSAEKAPAPTSPKEWTGLRCSDENEVARKAREKGYLEHSLKPTSPPPPPIPERSPSRKVTPRASQEQLITDSVQNQLPEVSSKIAMAYRTNEWAKHLEQAEAPIENESEKPTQPIDGDLRMVEPAAPVHVEALQQTPLTADPAPIRTRSHAEHQTPNRRQSASRDSLPSQQKSAERRTSLRRSSMGKMIDRSSSSTSLSRRNHRSSSTPMPTSPLAESPIEEDKEMTFPKRISAHPTNSMMAQRSSNHQNRYSSNPLTRVNSSTSLSPSRHASFDRSQNPYRVPSRPNLTPRTSATFVASPNPYPSRESLVANWRTSLQQDPRASNQALSSELERQQADLLMQQRKASAGIQAAEEEKARKEKEADRSIRRGSLLEAHQRAMRKMQGSVKQ